MARLSGRRLADLTQADMADIEQRVEDRALARYLDDEVDDPDEVDR